MTVPIKPGPWRIAAAPSSQAATATATALPMKVIAARMTRVPPPMAVPSPVQIAMGMEYPTQAMLALIRRECGGEAVARRVWLFPDQYRVFAMCSLSYVPLAIAMATACQTIATDVRTKQVWQSGRVAQDRLGPSMNHCLGLVSVNDPPTFAPQAEDADSAMSRWRASRGKSRYDWSNSRQSLGGVDFSVICNYTLGR